MSKRTAEEAGFHAVSSTSRGLREMQGCGAVGKKHSLDSDEEDDSKETKPENALLSNDDIDGQEELTIGRDGEINITPFNLKEEQEEGHFCQDGNFVWKKEKEIVDSWLDNVDWVKVKERSGDEIRRQDEQDEEEDEAEANYDEMTAYKECLNLMRKGESVARAIRRLGGGQKSLPKWKKSKQKTTETEEQKVNRQLMMKLTGFADSILSRSGNMEIYEETYEKISFKIKQMQPNLVIPEGTADDEALDMFATDLDSKKDKREEGGTTVALDIDAEVFWEFKWSDKDKEVGDDVEVHGPHSSKEMLRWQSNGFFAKGAFVRKAGSSGQFMNCNRIDFDLYA